MRLRDLVLLHIPPKSFSFNFSMFVSFTKYSHLFYVFKILSNTKIRGKTITNYLAPIFILNICNNKNIHISPNYMAF